VLKTVTNEVVRRFGSRTLNFTITDSRTVQTSGMMTLCHEKDAVVSIGEYPPTQPVSISEVVCESGNRIVNQVYSCTDIIVTGVEFRCWSEGIRITMFAFKTATISNEH
jgi:hypothetical protein